MTKNLELCDKGMFYSLCLLVIFIPYSSAMIQTSLFFLMILWVYKHSIIHQTSKNKSFLSSFSFHSNGLTWPMVAIGILILCTIPVSCAPMLTIKKFFSRYIQQIFLLLVTIEVINSQDKFYRIMFFMMWTLFVLMIDGVVQYFTGHSFIFHKHTVIYDRISAAMRHPNDLGTLLVTTIPIVVALLCTSGLWLKKIFHQQWVKPLKIFMWVLFILMIIALGMTSSRGAWVAFIFSLIGASVFTKNSKLIWITIVFLLGFFLVFSIYFTKTRSDIFTKTTTQNVQESSLESTGKKFISPSRRFQYWQTALKVFEQYPIIGCGYNAYIQTLQKLKLEPEEYPHNSVLHILAELGLIGLMFYIWFWMFVLWEGLKIIKTVESQHNLYFISIGLFFGVVAWLIHSLFDTPWESLQLSILWWFLVGVLFSLKNIVSK